MIRRPARLLRLCSPSLALALACLSAQAADGLQVRPGDLITQRWQARLQLNQLDTAGPLGSRLLGANLLGDYYLTGSLLGNQVSGGLRATGGLLLGPLSVLQGNGGLALGNNGLSNSRFAVGQRLVSLPGLGGSGLAGDYGSSLSYVGIGYTGQSLRSGWGFSADLGLAVSGLSDGLRLGRSTLSLDDATRVGRYQAVLQLGLNFRF
ncbi:hypothetical protein J7U46_06345 [Pelomonas sp. V22]|uniref:hypothetical protein n=1 Tax=Pelomonas sp. V22 TaxID=2822139 RepID=UPI0024A913EB|nr:hypothetical protein [Pelomonas sp. V22]MDI4632660.1 hypothetical protein [Pelomonas sp. V22]